MYLENTVTFDYGPVTGCRVDKLLGEAGGNLICISPSLEDGGGIQLLQIDKFKRLDKITVDDDADNTPLVKKEVRVKH